MPGNTNFTHKLLNLLSEPSFIKLNGILSEPNFFKVVGRSHYERWHSCFFGWLLDANGTHLVRDYVLARFLLLTFDDRCLKPINHLEEKLTAILPTVKFKNIDVTPNEFISTEMSVNDVGRFDIFLAADYETDYELAGRVNIIFELKIDSKVDATQSKKYADWLYEKHPNDINLLIYLLPTLLSNSKATVGDERWYCMDYQLLYDKLLVPILDHPNLNPKTQPFIVQYIKNLKSVHKGVKMAITNEEKRLAVDLYEKYSDVFDTIFDALQEANIIDHSTSDLQIRGRKSGRLVVKLDNRIVEGNMVRELFRNVLIYLVDTDSIKKIPLPWGIGKTRYIISNEEEAIHPNGKNFFYPISYQGYTIETHYSRERALSLLDGLCKKLELDFEIIDI